MLANAPAKGAAIDLGTPTGRTPSSWNELQVDASTIKVFLHYIDGRRELAVIRSRTTRAMVREAFYMTDDFLDSNQILAT